MLNNGFLLGIDPGSFKTGVAQVTPQGEVLNAEWVETKKLTEALNLLCSDKGLPQAVIIGNGTNTQPVHKVLAQIFTAVPVIEIDEKHSTEQARTLYWHALCTGSLTNRTAGVRCCRKVCVCRRNRWTAMRRRCL